MEKEEVKRYIDWLVEEILMNPNQRSRKDIELMRRCEFESRTVTLVTNLINELLDKAREDGYQGCMDDIWEEAKGLRSWTEHDGSVSSADIEAGLQEAYLNIENKLNNK